MNRRFTIFIVASMVLGILAGLACNQLLAGEQLTTAVDIFNLITTLFLRLIKMIIAPLVFTTLVVGIAHMEDAAAIRGVGFKAIAWFIFASLVSLSVGLGMFHLLSHFWDLGAGLNMTSEVTTKAAVDASTFTLKDFITHLIPTSIFDALATNQILQIVVFAVFVGTAVSALDDRAPAVMALVEQGMNIMLKVTGYVMTLAPIAIFAALAAAIAKEGLDIIGTYAQFIGGFYLSLGVLWTLLFLAAMVVLGGRAVGLFRVITPPTLLAFSTASSEAAYPRTLEALEKFGLPRRVVSFVLPLGYSFNLDGSMMYCTFAVLFIAKAHGIELTVAQQISMLLLLMVTSKGMAGVPRASLVVIMATLTYFGMDEAWIALVLAVDHLLDMGRSATNVVGNSVASAVVARWEGKRGQKDPVETPDPLAG
ncbi:dicarboxylate/amino acid:cation symporter [Caulobacter sp. NIBR1757]|uniref:dicarboxylate/amino acid:cation symporter n=1 Tax=Caulobacter sp. NIBR1757 TaxID=3016000 RepID=UPI0022F0E809|nr:dicarboxylate/amino acid:cation symporter [Caulobacter sp. NIBR1757]